tara:strand:+ start:719 stop:856 length:138 start_codon:yes stop_codon:yes gene_type:complete
MKKKLEKVMGFGYYGIFQTKRNQMFVARTPKMLERALRLNWKRLQ